MLSRAIGAAVVTESLNKMLIINRTVSAIAGPFCASPVQFYYYCVLYSFKRLS